MLKQFDQVFNVIEDHDTEIAREAVNWARQEGKLSEESANLEASLELTDADIDKLIAERTQAKKSRNFARADAIRNDLAAKGILLEDSKTECGGRESRLSMSALARSRQLSAVDTP